MSFNRVMRDCLGCVRAEGERGPLADHPLPLDLQLLPCPRHTGIRPPKRIQDVAKVQGQSPACLGGLRGHDEMN